VPDEKLLFISDAIPTGCAEFCNIQPGILAVWGCGAVGLFAMISAYMGGCRALLALTAFPNA